MVLEVAITILIFVIFLMGIVMRNLLIKNAKYESWFLETYNHTVDVLERMRDLDDKQMFEKDDEVGVLFEEIQSLVNSLGKNFENDE